MGLPPSCVRHVPTASKFSSANPIGSKILWHVAQEGLLVCNAITSRMVGVFVFPVVSAAFSFITGTLGGGSGGLTPRNVTRNHLPRTVGEVRAAYEVCVKSAPFP